jgi:hypothetical protein
MSEPVRRNTKKNLPAAKKRAKKRRERQNLDWAVQPLSYKDARQQVKADTRLRFGQVTDELKQRPQQIGNWFGQYQAQLKGIQQGVQQGYNQAIKEVDQRAAATQQSGQPIGNVDQSVLQQSGQAGVVRRQGNDAFANLLTAQRQTQDSYFGARSDIGGRQQVQELLDTGRMRQELKRDKGAFKASRLNELKESERRYKLERKAFGLSRYEAQVDAADKVADNDRAEREARRARRQKRREEQNEEVFGMPRSEWQGLSRDEKLRVKAEWEAAGRAPSDDESGAGRWTPVQRRANRNAWRTAKGAVEAASAETLRSPNYVAFLKKKYDVPADIAQIAIKWKLTGKITAKQAKRLRALGIKVKPTPVATVGPGNLGNTPGPNGQMRPN